MKDRQNIYKAFKSADIDIVISVNLYLMGVDFPKIETLFMSRPTLSPVLFAQMLGRGLRGPAFGGTEKVNVVDFADQYGIHSELAKERIMSFSNYKTANVQEITNGFTNQRVDAGTLRNRKRKLSYSQQSRTNKRGQLSKLVYDIRMKNIWTQAEMAEELGKSPGYISNIENRHAKNISKKLESDIKNLVISTWQGKSQRASKQKTSQPQRARNKGNNTAKGNKSSIHVYHTFSDGTTVKGRYYPSDDSIFVLKPYSIAGDINEVTKKILKRKKQYSHTVSVNMWWKLDNGKKLGSIRQ